MRDIITEIIDILFPRECIGCNRYPTTICNECLNSFSWPKKKRNYWTYSFGNYQDPPLKKILHHIKKNPDHELISSIVNKFISYFQNQPSLPDWIIVPIPITKKRFRERGYNQAELIAKAFSFHLGLPIISDLLIKTRNIQKQGTLTSPEDRFMNTLGAFAISRPLPAKHIIVVDDVTTSGATLQEVRTTLLSNGAHKVIAFTLAN